MIISHTTRKNILLATALVVIIGAIAYLEATKPPVVNPNTSPDVVVTPVSVAAVAESVSGSATSSAASVPASAPAAVSGNPKIALKTEMQKAAEYSKAKELVGIDGYVNSPAFTLSDYAGKKVILVDFWTYSCINCQRTIPYLNAWYQKYKDYGLVIVGVHTPEFDFEKNYGNVAAAVKSLGIQYPVVLDSERATWQAYQNEYWPAEYLVDIDGYVVHNSIGEGSYADTEHAIQQALIERDQKLGISQTVPTGTVSPSDVVAMDGSKVNSPETYFGSGRNEYLQNGTAAQSGSQTLTIPSTIDLNSLYLGGTWNFMPEYAESTTPGAKIVYQYDSKNLYMVASSDNANGVKATVLIDGKPIDPSIRGADVSADGTITIKANKLYQIVNGTDYGTHTLELDVQDAGLDAYTFTFG